MKHVVICKGPPKVQSPDIVSIDILNQIIWHDGESRMVCHPRKSTSRTFRILSGIIAAAPGHVDYVDILLTSWYDVLDEDEAPLDVKTYIWVVISKYGNATGLFKWLGLKVQGSGIHGPHAGLSLTWADQKRLSSAGANPLSSHLGPSLLT